MERFNALGRGTQIMLVSSVLLLIISFFNWQEVEFDLGPLGEGSAGVSAWDDLGGILMGILTIVLIARIVAQLAAVNLPVPVSYAMTTGVLAFLIFAIALIKNLTDDYSTWASYVGVVLAFLIAVFIFASFVLGALLAVGLVTWAWLWWRTRSLRRDARRGDVIDGEFRDVSEAARLEERDPP